jgi:hypothetical protein
MSWPDSIHFPRQPPPPRLSDAANADEFADRRLVRCALSRLIASTRAKKPAGYLCWALALYGRTGVPHAGRMRPPSHPDVPLGPFPVPVTALRHLGVTQRELCDRFEELEALQGTIACFDDELIEAFVPRLLWSVFERMIEDCPAIFGQRATRAVAVYSKRILPGNRRRESGPPAKGSVQLLYNEFSKISTAVRTMAADEFPSPRLAAWSHAKPSIKMAKVAPRGYEVRAPRPERCRSAFRDCGRDIARRLGGRPGMDELEAIRRLPISTLDSAGLFRPLRDRVATGLMVITGGRIDATLDVMLADYRHEHLVPYPDNLRSSVVVLRPGKGLHQDVECPKAIPEEFAAMIDAYLCFVDRMHAARFGEPWTGVSDATRPLLIGTLKTPRRWSTAALRQCVSGTLPARDGTHAVRPLIPRESGWSRDLPPELRQFVGYTPAEMRHLASQLGERAGEIWNADHPAVGALPTAPPALYATALLDHGGKADERLRAIYGDWNIGAVREVLAARAVAGIWRLLTTDEGARKRIDTDAYSSCYRRLQAIKSEIATIGEKTQSIGDRARAQDGDLLRAVLEVVTMNQRLMGLYDERVRTERRLTELRLDPALYAALPDDAPDGSERVDLAALEAEIRGDSPTAGTPAHETQRLRLWLTIGELAWIAGVSRSIVCHWVAGRHLGGQRRPWDSHSIPLDTSLGRSYRRIAVESIRSEFWHNATMHDRLEQVLRTMPREQGWMIKGQPGPRCFAPLVVYGPIDSSRAEVRH